MLLVMKILDSEGLSIYVPQNVMRAYVRASRWFWMHF